MKPELANDHLFHMIEEQDLEQMRRDNRLLVAENVLLRQRIIDLEQYIVTNARMDCELH
ncbi:MAG: hypothetical protein HRT77_05100, partial [Halioglobus sp.]|nr:hypothetical protein [Halioglobus sp.]